MEAENDIDKSSDTSSVSDNIPNDDIASPDPVEDTVVSSSNKTFFGEDDRSQTPLQDEVEGASQQVADIAGRVQEVEISEVPQQTSQQDTSNADASNRSDNAVLKQSMRDDHGELDYDEEVQPDGCPVASTNGGSPANTHQKAVAEEEKEDGEEKVHNCLCFCSLLPYFPDYKLRLFFKNFRVAAYIPVRLMCGRFQKTTHYTLHATACLDQHLITINSPTVVQCSTITDCLCSRVATPPPPAVSLSVYAWTRPSTARTGRVWENARLMSRAEHAAVAPRRTPDFDPHNSHN